MCLIVFSYRQHKSYPFIMIANRDEFYRRPTASMHYWEEQPSILAGRDLEQMGSWLGLHSSGRFSAVTNFRKLPNNTQYPLSRGKLIVDSLTHSSNLKNYLQSLARQRELYAPYNLLTADDSGLYFSNNHENIQAIQLKAGLYGLCNASLDTPWPKLTSAKATLAQVIKAPKITIEDLQYILQNRDTAAAHELANTGLSPEWEKALSSQFIALEDYGTRAKSILLQRSDGYTQIREITYRDGKATTECSFEMQLPLIGGR